MPPTISIVITVYNRERYLGAAIESVLKQTHRDFELLIWDDGSTDKSGEIARHYALLDKRIRVMRGEQSGVAHALKSAVSATSGDYLGWVDSDDILAPTALEETISILNNYLQVGLVYTDYQLIDECGNLHGIGHRSQIPYSKERLLVDFMTFHFRLLRRTAYEYIGGIDTTFAYAEDYDLCLKLSEITEVHHIAQSLYYYRLHETNITNNQFEVIRWTHKAITNALKRRGLDSHYFLDMSLVAQFSIKSKHRLNNAPISKERFSNEPPTVSIIIPTYNRKHYLGRALDSIRTQTYTDYEIIVIDDGSTDGTADWVRNSYPYINLLQLPANIGAAAARNAGIKIAQGKYIAFLDSDDEWLPDYLYLSIHTLKQNPTAVLSYCNYIATTTDCNKGNRVRLAPNYPDDLILSMLTRCFIHTLSQVIVPKSIFKTTGFFCEQLRGCHDWEFYLRLFAHGTPVHVPDYLVCKYWLKDSIVTQSNCSSWLTNGLKALSEFYRHNENTRYIHLRPTIETHLHANVEAFKIYITSCFDSQS